MLKKFLLIAVLAPFAALPAFAQATRADVKSEAASANKSGSIAKGEDTKAAKPKSTAARSDVKTEAKADNKAGGTVDESVNVKPTKAKSEKARSDVKADATKANKSGAIATGEAQKP